MRLVSALVPAVNQTLIPRSSNPRRSHYSDWVCSSLRRKGSGRSLVFLFLLRLVLSPFLLPALPHLSMISFLLVPHLLLPLHFILLYFFIYFHFILPLPFLLHVFLPYPPSSTNLNFFFVLLFLFSYSISSSSVYSASPFSPLFPFSLSSFPTPLQFIFS